MESSKGSKTEIYNTMESDNKIGSINSGIIYIRSEDPISRLYLTLTSNDYNIIGFYCPSTSSGKMEILVVLIDIFRQKAPIWQNQDIYTFDGIINNELISRISRQELRYTNDIKKNEIKFRAKIANIVNNLKPLSDSEMISYLFLNPNYFQQLMDNLIIQIIDQKDNLSPILDLPIDRSLDFIITIRKKSLKMYRPELNEFINKIIDEMVNEDFTNKILHRLNSDKDLILSLSEGSYNLMNFIMEAVMIGDLHLDKLKDIINNNNIILEQIAKYYHLFIEPINIPTINDDHSMNISTDNNVIKTINRFIIHILETIDKSETVHININDLIKIYNDINSDKPLTLRHENLSYPCILYSGSSEMVTLPFKNDIIILPNKCTSSDLDRFTPNELREIAITLDALPNNEQFTFLRSAIARKLSGSKK